MNKLIREENVNGALIKLYWADNNCCIGSFECDMDGYFYFWDNPKCVGAMPQCILEYLATRLAELNKPYDDQLNDYFNGQLQLLLFV